MGSDEATTWGRVDENGTVYVRYEDGERAVGEYPDATADEALAYFARKYADLEGQVKIAEQRVQRGASANDVSRTVAHLREQLADARVVGDIKSLEDRVQALTDQVGSLTKEQAEQAQQALTEALAYRAALVEEAEGLAAVDPARAQWKQITAQLDDVFARWQQHQHDGPRIPKNEANELWKRFRAARSTVDQHRRAFYSELDAQHRDAGAASRTSSRRPRRSRRAAPTRSRPTGSCWTTGSERAGRASGTTTHCGHGSRRPVTSSSSSVTPRLPSRTRSSPPTSRPSRHS